MRLKGGQEGRQSPRGRTFPTKTIRDSPHGRSCSRSKKEERRGVLKALFIKTSSNETDKYVDCLATLQLGPVEKIAYDTPGLEDETLVAKAKELAPDVIVYIGARWGKTVSPAALAHMNAKVAPTVHICSDAADAPWHDLLREYHQCGAFSLQVAIDGSHKWPLSNHAMTALTPVEPGLFGRPLPHKERPIPCGYAGNPGAGNGSRRTGMLSALLERKTIDQLHIRSNLPHTNGMYNRFLGLCRLSVSIAWTGTETALHVKGRVLESGLAGACLLETKGAPTSYWFRPGLDYLEYGTPDEATDIVRRLANEPEASQAIGFSLRQRILNEHTPHHFWTRIFNRIGLVTQQDPVTDHFGEPFK